VREGINLISQLQPRQSFFKKSNVTELYKFTLIIFNRNFTLQYLNRVNKAKPYRLEAIGYLTFFKVWNSLRSI